MIKIENVEVMGWEHAIRGMRNPMNSWEKSDSGICKGGDDGIGCENCANYDSCEHTYDHSWQLGKADHDLMMRLVAGGSTHAKYRRMIVVYVDITAPLYWWKEFDTYKVGTVANSCSTMHKIAAKEFTLDDFSHEHLIGNENLRDIFDDISISDYECYKHYGPKDILNCWVIPSLNLCREKYLKTKDKKYWWQMIQLLPSSYNQKRTVMLNYEVLAHIYKDRRNHKLDEWSEHPIIIDKLDILSVGLTKDGFGVRGTVKETKQEYFGFCDWIKTLPYSEIIVEERVKLYADGKEVNL